MINAHVKFLQNDEIRSGDDDIILELRFNLITYDSKDGTANLKGAVPEIYAVCRRLKRTDITEKEIGDELKKRRNSKRRVEFSAFKEVCLLFSSRNQRPQQVPHEFEEKFNETAHPYQSVDISDALDILKEVYEESGNEKMSFTRTKNNWDDTNVQKMLNDHSDGGSIKKDNF